jgi:hypothetical protein
MLPQATIPKGEKADSPLTIFGEIEGIFRCYNGISGITTYFWQTFNIFLKELGLIY